MCGIAGIYSLSTKAHIPKNTLEQVALSLDKRGPDNQSIVDLQKTIFIHARLSIIDVSEHANQPFFDKEKRYSIIFNGEIFNYIELKKDLQNKGYTFSTQSDTEVLLYAYIHYKEDCLNKLNGFFSLAIYDSHSQDLFVALDRFGVKPLYYSVYENNVYFASELKSLMHFDIPKKLNWTAMSLYFQLNYIPDKHSIFEHINKLKPGHYILIKKNQIEIKQWYSLPYDALAAENNTLNYQQQQDKFYQLLDDAVRLRLISDVPLGAFLSGGIDSSVIVALASKYTSQLNTFSIGFEDASFFDETHYANLVAKHFNTHHTVFKLKNDDLLNSLYDLLAYTDEPFADSSALLVNLLSKYTRQHVTVALSGDGGDELFAGYNKHYGEWQCRNGGWKAKAIQHLLPIWEALPKSRNGKISNKIRQLQRFAEGMNVDRTERYWNWCSFVNFKEADTILRKRTQQVLPEIIETKQNFTQFITHDGTLNDCLRADVALVLAYDMLVKVDRMSMCNSLEVRTPFLDYRVVEFAFSIPVSSKINAVQKKKIVQDTFKKMLPAELYNRPKKGFEVPLLQWFKTDLKTYLDKEIFDLDFIQQQQIFDINYIDTLKKQLHSNNPGDVHAKIWAMLLFQNFYKKYIT